MLPGLRFIFLTAMLSVSLVVFGLGMLGMLRSTKERFATTTLFSRESTVPSGYPTLALLRTEPLLPVANADQDSSGQEASVNETSAAVIAPESEPAPALDTAPAVATSVKPETPEATKPSEVAEVVPQADVKVSPAPEPVKVAPDAQSKDAAQASEPRLAAAQPAEATAHLQTAPAAPTPAKAEKPQAIANAAPAMPAPDVKPVEPVASPAVAATPAPEPTSSTEPAVPAATVAEKTSEPVPGVTGDDQQVAAHQQIDEPQHAGPDITGSLPSASDSVTSEITELADAPIAIADVKLPRARPGKSSPVAAKQAKGKSDAKSKKRSRNKQSAAVVQAPPQPATYRAETLPFLR